MMEMNFSSYSGLNYDDNDENETTDEKLTISMPQEDVEDFISDLRQEFVMAHTDHCMMYLD